MSVSGRLAELGLTLPPVPKPAGAYVPALRHGDLVWTAGQLPFVNGELPHVGVVGAGDGAQVTIQQAVACARQCALNALAAVASVADLDDVRQVVKVVGFVASEPGFTGQPTVINGASDLLGEIFGAAGRHARSAVGVAALPAGTPVEVEMIVALGG